MRRSDSTAGTEAPARTGQLPPGVRLHLPPDDGQCQQAPCSSPAELKEPIRAAALELGLLRAGFTGVERFADHAERFAKWLEQGLDGEMGYLAEQSDRANPTELLPNARTLIAVAIPYAYHPPPVKPGTDADSNAPLCGAIARYAQGDDYHRVLKQKLSALADACARIARRPVLARPCVGSAPLLERAAAQRAGIGFFGNNTMTIVPGVGSRVLLGELLVDLEIAADPPLERHCEDCSACLEACPTGALVAPGVLDARRCIAYLTIELRDVIPRELRSALGTRIFGCDACQDVCPFNADPASPAGAPELAPRAWAKTPDLVSLLELGSSSHRRLVKKTPLSRASRPRLARNAAIALGNTADQRAVVPLCRALERDLSPLVRRHVAWALGRLGGDFAVSALEQATAQDSDQGVREEARLALSKLGDRPAGA